MATRSSLKCCVSLLTLDPDDAFPLQGRYVHKKIASAWVRAYGPSQLPDGSACPTDANGESLFKPLVANGASGATNGRPEGPEASAEGVPESSLLARQMAVITSEFNGALTAAVTGQTLSATYRYLKALMAWNIIVDSRGAIETIARASSVCNEVVASSPDTVEAFQALFSSVLSAIMLLPNLSAILSDIDEQRMHLSGSSNIVDTAIWRYALTGTADPLMNLLSLGTLAFQQ